MKSVFLLALTVLSALGASAQGVARVTEELARAGFGSGARIEVSEADDAASAIRSADRSSGRSTVMAYGVSLFRDNSQNAGANARAVRGQFAEMYPGIPVEIVYENPYFKVEAGPLVERIDAVALCGKVSATFKEAVIVQQQVGLAEIIASERAEAREQEAGGATEAVAE